jgi:hypothetical protein
MKFILARLMTKFNITGNRFKTGLKLSYNSAKEIIKGIASGNIFNKRKISPPDISAPDQALPSSINTKHMLTENEIELWERYNIGKTGKSNISIKTGFLSPSLGVTLIIDFFQQSINYKEN